MTTLRFSASGGTVESAVPSQEGTAEVIIPGLVNAHAHSGMAVLRGLGDGLALEDWLKVVMAAEDTLTEDDMRWSLSLAVCEMIRAGTTAFADMFHWTEPLIDTVIQAGLRVAAAPVVFGEGITPYLAAGTLGFPAQLDHIERLAARYASEPLVRIAYGPHAVYTCGADVFREVAERTAAGGLGVHVHLSGDLARGRHRPGRTGPDAHRDRRAYRAARPLDDHRARDQGHRR
ncbi:amidohydrolase family protein [Spongiactinospora gelatinilytica]|uniref:amidohydrolase family protein n=1 Tax=Spongiactinospora gelatinilytica TaxID=2666298 RepID=UPI001F441DF2|nr:amidohydrolase family protein [Spongiactinospora gelatinilytica]